MNEPIDSPGNDIARTVEEFFPPPPTFLAQPPPAPAPERIGRYQITRLLGEGAFGRVYLAQDDELDRLVAVKVPHQARMVQPDDFETYLAEARTLAGLDHPHIVPVYDAGRANDGLFFVVSKFIEGSDLMQKLGGGRPSHAEAAELTAVIAEALHYAHTRRVVHRDVKPANILIDKAGRPYLADFGLALKEEDFGKGSGFAGTPAYMSPEQARGEGHRVDGRSDVFSLGVVFYEMLSGRRPFRAEGRAELLAQIIAVEARPPRQVDDAIPRELERICLRALAKWATERYPTARDFAEDLRHFLAGRPANAPAPPPSASSSDWPPLKVLPKGLRSFDAGDADFFLELLPGPRDRNGLPDGVRFWKCRVEETDPDATFRVGVLYGASGCGKSSLVKAGLLPRLAGSVCVVHVEATAADTEARLLKALRKRRPGLAADAGLAETVAALRRGRDGPAGAKVLIVVDQFEQWLHARRAEEGAELVQALRQCDGERVQCLLLVRDDFWMPLTRFMHLLEVRLVEGENCAAVDLFDLIHARKVLAAFGRAFGRLSDEPSLEQEAFLEQAVQGLSQNGRVISVRLALFAEMVKGRLWTPATLKAVGGAEGVGAAFLEDAFSSPLAIPRNRLHQEAARSVLKTLLPEQGADIKGAMQSHAKLLQASGYARRPKDFEDLLQILDREVRLITPTQPPEQDSPDDGLAAAPADKYYQLTHDYLVHSLREWLTRKQRETWRGRAEIRLAFWASLWNAKPENRNLPSLWGWLNMRVLTDPRHWTPPQRKMMRRAAGRQALRGLAAALLLAAAAVAGLRLRAQAIEQNNATRAAGLVNRLLDADTAATPDVVADMRTCRPWIDPLLREAYAEAARTSNARRQLHASLALLPVDGGQVDYLYDRLLDAEPQEAAVIIKALGDSDRRQDLVGKLWPVVSQPPRGHESRRLRAACALAQFDPDSPRWSRAAGPVVEQLVSVSPVFLAPWMEALRPVREKLLAALAEVFRDYQEGRAGERNLATNILAAYVADSPEWLLDLLQDADEKQFAVLFPKFEAIREQGAPLLDETLAQPADSEKTEEGKEQRAKRQANAAVALLRAGREDAVWALLKQSPDPRVRSYLINRLGPLGAEPAPVIKRLEGEQEVSVRRALILSLGEFGPERLGPAERENLAGRLLRLYRDDPDPGLHAAAGWLLRQWNYQEQLRQVGLGLATGKPEGRRGWYVNGQGQTMVVIPGPSDFMMGSPPTEDGREADEIRHRKRIGRTFAIADKPVTKEQFLRFLPGYDHSEMRRYPDPECPIGGVKWYEAAEYCNWLSKQEGIDPEELCYEADSRGRVTRLKERYLSRTGYRLPTEAEMEYATRGGSATSRFYGESEELLPKYAWYLKNSADRSWPVGGKKPNDFGLFDMHGNILNWCQEKYQPYPQDPKKEDIEDVEYDINISEQDSRVVRGASFNGRGSSVRSANRDYNVPTHRINYFVGFRPARTVR